MSTGKHILITGGAGFIGPRLADELLAAGYQEKEHKDSTVQDKTNTESREYCGIMQAAVITEPNNVIIEDVNIPEPASDEVRVRLEGCGVCSSNLPPWEGRPWFNYPMEPGALGHEGWGQVDAIGSDVNNITIGDRVAFISNHAYAQYDVAPASNVIRLPHSLGRNAFPGEPLGCAMNIFRRSEIYSGQTIAIIGIGFLGALLTRLASLAGTRVIAISRRPFSLEVAKSMGADEIIEMNDHCQIIKRVSNITEGKFCDCTVEATGKQWPLDLAGEITCERGRMVIAGYHQEGLRQVNMQLWNWRGIDVINAHERDMSIYMEGMKLAVDAVSGGLLNPADLLTNDYPLESLGEALDATRDRPDGFLKAVVRL